MTYFAELEIQLNGQASISLLRGYGHRRQGRAVTEGIVRYRHQGGGQDHTHQIIISYKPTR